MASVTGRACAGLRGSALRAVAVEAYKRHRLPRLGLRCRAPTALVLLARAILFFGASRGRAVFSRFVRLATASRRSGARCEARSRLEALHVLLRLRPARLNAHPGRPRHRGGPPPPTSSHATCSRSRRSRVAAVSWPGVCNGPELLRGLQRRRGLWGRGCLSGPRVCVAPCAVCVESRVLRAGPRSRHRARGLRGLRASRSSVRLARRAA